MASINTLKKYECFLLLLLSIVVFIIIVRYFLSEDNNEGFFGRRGRRGNPFKRMIKGIKRKVSKIAEVNRNNPYQSQANNATNEYNRKQNELRRLKPPKRNIPKRPPNPKLAPPKPIRYARPSAREQNAFDRIKNFPLEVVKPINEVGRVTIDTFNDLEGPINEFKNAAKLIDFDKILKVFNIIPQWLLGKRKKEVKQHSVYESSSVLAQSIKNEAQKQVASNVRQLQSLNLIDKASDALEGASTRLQYVQNIADNDVKTLELERVLKEKKLRDEL
jgi:hypothetical protein